MPSYTKATSEIIGNLVLAYGRHVVAGTVVQKVTEGFGENAQTTVIVLLGEGEWDSLEKIYWGGSEIPASDYHFHLGTSTQAADAWNVNGNPFPNTAYIIVKLPLGAVSSDEEDFSKLKMICRCLKVQNYDSNGTPVGSKIFSVNPALVAADIILNRRGLPASRIDWPSWVAWRDFCDFQIAWTGGETSGRPSYQNLVNVIQSDNGGLSKPYGIPANAWNGFASTVQSIPVGVDGYYDADIDKGTAIIGLSTVSNPTSITQINFGLYFNANGTLYLYRNPGDLSTAIGTWASGDRIRVSKENGAAKVYKNGQVIDISSYGIGVPNAPLFGVFAGYTQYSGLIRASFRPMGSTARSRARFEAGLAFAQTADVSTALEAVLYVSCSNYQDVDGKIKFIIPSMQGAERVPTYTFNMSNIVEDSFETYRLTADQRPTKLIGRFRDADDQYLKEDRVVIRREVLETALGRPNDGGEVFLGTMTRGQAQCVMNYQMRMASDLDLYCKIKGDARSFLVVPGDVVEVSHDVTGWANLRFLVIEAIDDSPTDSAETRTFILQLFNPTSYSDTDQTPLTSSVRSVLPSELTGPPDATISSLVAIQNRLPGDVWISKIRGRVTFNTSYAPTQRAKVYITRPNEAEVLTDIVLTPSPAGFAEFEYTAPSTGNYLVRIVTESGLGIVENTAGVSAPVTVTNIVRTLPTPVNQSAVFSVNSVVYTWSHPLSNYDSVEGYEIWNDTSTIRLWRGRKEETTWTETFSSGSTGSVQRQLRSVDSHGNASAFVPMNAVQIISLPAPSSFDYVLEDNKLLYTIVPSSSMNNFGEWQISDTPSFTVIRARSKSNTLIEPISTGSRSFTRYARAIDNIGNPGISTGAVSKNFGVNNPPTLTLREAYATSAYYNVIRPVDFTARIGNKLIVEIGTDNSFSTVLERQILDQLSDRIAVSGQVSARATVHIRARYEDSLGAGTNSTPVVHTFQQLQNGDLGAGSVNSAQLAAGAVGDAAISMSSNFSKMLTATSQTPISGGGNISWDGTNFVITQKLTISPVDRTISTDGFFELG